MQREMQRKRIRKQGHQPALMRSVIEDRHFSSSFGAELLALVAVLDRDGEPQLRSGIPRSRYSNSSAHKCTEHGEETAVVAADGAHELTVVAHAGELVQH